MVQAEEYNNVRLRANEKKLYKEINRSNGIKFPIKVDLAMHAHKRSLIVQSELGGVEFPVDEQYSKHKRQFNQDKALIFDSIHRLIRCIIDCQIHLQDAVAVRNALELARSFGARVWDNSPLQMKQVSQIGLVAIRKLAIGGINTIEALEAAEPHRIEMLLSKNPPFGNRMLANLKDFPKLRVSVKMMGKESKKGRPVVIKIKAEVGFINDKIPAFFRRKPVYICLLTERSDGFLVDFRRISASKLNKSPDVLYSAELLKHTQYFTCHVMCDEIAGTMRSAELRPDLPPYLFPPSPEERQQSQTTGAQPHQRPDAGRIEKHDDIIDASPMTLQDDEFDDKSLNDQDMMDACKKSLSEQDFSEHQRLLMAASVDDIGFRDVDSVASLPEHTLPIPRNKKQADTEKRSWNPEKLENGKWACNHKCKDKNG